MKISVILAALIIFSTTVCSTSTDGGKSKRKVKKESVRVGQPKFPGPFAGPSSEGLPGVRPKPRIPYVDEETGANRINVEFHDNYKVVKKGHHDGVNQQSRHVGKGQQGRHVRIVHQGRHVGEHHQSHHVGVETQGRPVGVLQSGRHDGIDHPGHQVGVENQGGQMGDDQQLREVRVNQQGRSVVVDQQSRPVASKQDGRQAYAKQRGRTTRQSHNTFLTVQVPSFGSLIGGSQGSGALLQQTPSLSPGGSHTGHRPGNQAGFVIPDGVFHDPGGSVGSNGGFRPDPLGSIALNGHFPFITGNPTGGSPGTSSAIGPGGLSSGPDTGLAGGLGGVYGAGYGFGLGGLIFGGQNGPVFAGNAALSDGLSGNPEGVVANDELEEPNKQNAVQTPRLPVFRPVPLRGNSFGADKAKPSGQPNRVVTRTYHKVQNPNGNGRTSSPTSNDGETIGYVAFIFPKQHSQKQISKAVEASRHSSTVKSAVEATMSKPKVEAGSVSNRPVPIFLPVPAVHIPIDRPYPVLVPKPYPVEVLKPYPVAVTIREPVPYEVARPIPVPVAVPAEVVRPAESPFLAGVNGIGSVVLQPTLETSILHKRSDKTDSAKFA